MSDEARWAFGIVFLVLIAGAGILWKHGERLAKNETDIETIKEEVAGLRKRWHDLREVTLKELWDLFHEKLEKLRDEFRRSRGE